MIRVLIFLVLLAAVALGASWLLERPGDIVVTWQGYEYRSTIFVGLLGLLGAAIVLALALSLLRFVVGMPAWMSQASRSRRRSKGYAALTRGVVAVGAGDSRGAVRHAQEAGKLLDGEPLVLLLKAQAAQLSGDRAGAEANFAAMLDVPETRVLGLRGLHVEARRRGDAEAAHRFAAEAQRAAPLPWAGQAVLEHHAARHDWAEALAAVERNAAGKLIDKAAADRQRAVLKTALALERAEREPDAALDLARDAVRLAPDLVPAAVLVGQLTARRGDLRKASRLLERTWQRQPHPDLAQAYLNVRPGDSARDRLARAEKLGDLALEDPESHLTIARAAIETRDFDLARKTMAPIFRPGSPYGRPTVRACLLMADLEEAAGAPGSAREWLARASHAARDPAWVADGVVADRWSPISPVNGRLDAFVWQKPSEQLSAPAETFPPLLATPAAPEAQAAAPRIEATTPDLDEPPEPQDAPAAGDAAAASGGPEPEPASAAPLPTPAQPTARAESLPVAAPSAMPTAARVAPVPRAVIFPMPTAPDDPGPDRRLSERPDDPGSYAGPVVLRRPDAILH